MKKQGRVKEVIVTGGRDYSNKSYLEMALGWLDPTRIIQSGSDGAAKLARSYAIKNNIYLRTYEADWSLGKKAIPLRNQKMLETYPYAIVVAFPGGKGTDNCVKQALKLGMAVIDLRELKESLINSS